MTKCLPVNKLTQCFLMLNVFGYMKILGVFISAFIYVSETCFLRHI